MYIYSIGLLSKKFPVTVPCASVETISPFLVTDNNFGLPFSLIVYVGTGSVDNHSAVYVYDSPAFSFIFSVCVPFLSVTSNVNSNSLSNLSGIDAAVVEATFLVIVIVPVNGFTSTFVYTALIVLFSSNVPLIVPAATSISTDFSLLLTLISFTA